MPGPERVNVRNGYRHRDFDTRAGTLDVAIPKLRSGSYFPDWLPECRRRAEAALTSVVATCYLLGVSTHRMEKLVEALRITRLSRSQVSEMARDLDEQVEAFRTRPLNTGPYTFAAADALVLKVREGGPHGAAFPPRPPRSGKATTIGISHTSRRGTIAVKDHAGTPTVIRQTAQTSAIQSL